MTDAAIGTRQFAGRTVVVTGAARGIGKACAERFMAAGASVIGLDRFWDVNGGASSCAAERGLTAALTVDLARPADVQAAYEDTLARTGQVDVLVNNAALRQNELFPPAGVSLVLETTDDQWQRMFEVNVLGPLRMARVFGQSMLERNAGSIINIGSRGSVVRPAGEGMWIGRQPSLRNQPYDATKSAMCSMSFYLADELKENGVKVNVVFPGATRTTGSDAVAAARRAAGMPMSSPHLLRPEHVAPIVCHLADAGADVPTGVAYDSLQWNRDHGFGGLEEWYAE